MRTIIVHNPVSVGHTVDDVKATVIELNLAILMEKDFPGDIPFLSVKELIGDPNYGISDHVCAMLAEAGVLTRTPVLDANGRQSKIKIDKEEELLWNYTWNEMSIQELSLEQLYDLAWDLRQHPNFCHVSVVNDVEETDQSSKESLDSEEPEEYDSSDPLESDAVRAYKSSIAEAYANQSNE